MPLTRIKNTAIGDDGVTTRKLDDTTGGFTMPGQQFMKVPVGTTAQRPTSPENGHLRYNTNFERLEQYADGQWQSIDTPPSITSLSYAGSLTGADPAGGETITLAGTNFQAGALVSVGGTPATSVTVVGSTSITFTTPAKTAGDYDVTVTNSNGLAATLLSGISYNGVPAFTTAAGNVGSIEEDETMATITIVAAEPDGGTLAYSITSGALPTGVSMSSAGAITGTPNVNPTADTTFNFTVTATDDENQTNSRAFNLVVLRPVYAHTLNESLRLHNNDSGSVERTQGTPTNGKIWTYAFWWRRGDSISESANRKLMIAMNASNHQEDLRINTDNTLRWYSHNSAASAADSDLNFTRPLASTNDWHHICLVKDTTQATASNRAKLYIDGVLQTAGSLSYPSLNYEGHVNKSGSTFHIGDKFQGTASGYYSDCYFVDGQALTPSSFTEVHNGTLVPKAYSGTYGNNGFHVMGNNSVPRTTFTSGSMEFDGTTGANVYISSGNINSDLSIDGEEYTIECFIKPDALGSDTQDYILTIGTFNSVIHYAFSYGTAYGLSLGAGNGWGWATNTFHKTGRNLEFGKWHHIAVCGDDSTGVKRYYTNGVLTGSFTGEAFPSNGLTNLYIGNYYGQNSWFDGKISNLRCVVGSQLYTGETYTVPSSTLTAVTGTKLLVGTDGTVNDQMGVMTLAAGSGVTLHSSDTIDVWEMYGAKDTSGNGNHMLISDGGTSAAASTARGAGTKITKSTNTPTSSYPTFVDNREYGAGYQAVVSKAGTESNTGGNATHNFLPVDITEFDPVGVYWEATCTVMDSSRTYAGIIGRSGNMLSVSNSNGASYAYTDKVILNRNGSLYADTGTGTTALNSYAANDTLMFAYKEGKFWIGKNGTWMNAGDPAAGTGNVGPADIRTQHPRGWQPYVGYNSKWEINMGSENGGFEYTVPTGFVALSNNNRPSDDYINQALSARQTKKFFNMVGWTGNGSSQAITGLGFQPDMVWIWGQNTDAASVYDSVRGATSGYYNRLYDFGNAVEQVGGVITDSITSFDSDGFTVNSAGNGSYVNDTSDKYVAAAWYIGGSATTNTDGDIQSSVIVNQDLGISIGTYTGNGQTSRQTIGHGLGEIPSMILAKKRDTSTGGWQCKMVDMEAASVNSVITPGNNAVRNDSTTQFSGGGLAGLSTTTTFGVQGGTSNNNNLNQDTASNVFYAFAERTGFSKFSSYRGSGQTDGPYIPCGFKPEFIFLYDISSASYGGYCFAPNAMSDVGVDGRGILYFVGNSNTGQAYALTDSNGFTITQGSGQFPAANTAGNLYVFWAWASAPNKYATDQSTNWPN